MACQYRMEERREQLFANRPICSRCKNWKSENVPERQVLDVVIPLGFLFEEITITGTRRTKNLKALFDSGARRNFIRKSFSDKDKVDDLGYRAYLGKKHVILPDERNTPTMRVIFDNIKVRGLICWNVEFLIMDKLIHDVILGSGFMQEQGVILDLSEHKIELRARS